MTVCSWCAKPSPYGEVCGCPASTAYLLANPRLPACSLASRLPIEGACRCGKARHKDGSPVTWRCHVCKRLVCRDCTLTMPLGPDDLPNAREYYTLTLCSLACWKAAGSPED